MTIERVVLDACCTLNLSATGRMEIILHQLPYQFCIGSRARSEAQWLAIPGSDEREIVDLQPLVEQGLLAEEHLQGSVEESLFVEFGASVADGEAEAAALAVNRGYLFATDDRKARRVVTARSAAVRLLSTLELMHSWEQTVGLPTSDIADALHRIATRATYRPRRSDPLWSWWAALTDA